MIEITEAKSGERSRVGSANAVRYAVQSDLNASVDDGGTVMAGTGADIVESGPGRSAADSVVRKPKELDI